MNTHVNELTHVNKLLITVFKQLRPSLLRNVKNASALDKLFNQSAFNF